MEQGIEMIQLAFLLVAIAGVALSIFLLSATRARQRAPK